MNFIGISFAVIAESVCAVAVSAGDALVALAGLRIGEVLDFLWNEREARKSSLKSQDSGPKNPRPETWDLGSGTSVFVAFDFAVDLELLFRDLAGAQKDILYGLNNGTGDRPPEYRRAARDRITERQLYAEGNPLAESEVKPAIKISHDDYTLTYLPGKILRICLPGRTGLNVFDVSSYFAGCDLSEAATEYLNKQIPRVEKNLLPLWQKGLAWEIAQAQLNTAETVSELAEKVKATITPLGLTPRSWYGPAAIAAHCLNKWGARKQARRLHAGNSPDELLKAIDVAYIGGRVEAVKLGTIPDVRTFDLNSAYGYATTLLSQFYAPLKFTRRYERECPFACWLVEYDLPKEVNIGILPTRAVKGGISFASRGRGYFWQPEVDYLAQVYPDAFDVQWGYVTPDYKPVTFAPEIQKMYDYRMVLKARGDKGEKIIKLALSNLYGKFAQNKGTAFYQCRAWAGWITSLVRRLMLEAVTGIEDRVICFSQDAIHVQGREAEVTIGEGLGEWKRDEFAEGLYVAPGIYDLRKESSKGQRAKSEAEGKQAARGANLGLDFNRLATELSERQVSELSRSFFVGWQMARQNPVRYEGNYLQEVVEALSVIPANLKARNYLTDFDWHTESRDSTIRRDWTGQLSARYLPADSQSSGLRLRLKDRHWK